MPSRRTVARTDGAARRAQYLRSCRPNVAELAAGAVERAVLVGRAGSRIAARRSSAVRPGNVDQPVPIATACVGVAVADRRRGRAPRRTRTTRPCHGRPSIVGLNASIASGPDARVAVGEQPPEHPALGAQRVRDERMGGDREAALLVDLGDRRPQRLRSGRTRSSMNSASRWPPSVETSSPTITSARMAEVAGHRPGGDARRRSARGR